MRKTGRFLAICAILFLTACGKGEIPDGNGGPKGSAAGNAAGIAQGKEWAYVPEVLWVGDERADYEDMRLIGDMLYYIQMPREDADSAKNICRYSMSDKALKVVPIDWQPEGAYWEKGAYAFDRDCNVWLIANVYSADFSQLRRFLCQFDSEGKNIAALEITEQLGRGISIDGIVADRQGRIYIYTDEYSDEAGIWLYTGDGSFHGSIEFGTSETVGVKGIVEGQDGKTYVCISKGEDSEYCTLMEADFEGCSLTVLTEEFPNIDGFCSGKRPDGDLAGDTGYAGIDDAGTAGAEGQTEALAEQYDFLLYDHTFAYGCNLSRQKSGSRPVVEELFAWADSDVNGYYVMNLGISEDGRYFCMVEDWMNDDRCVVFLSKTKAEEAPEQVNMTLAAVNGGSELAAMAVRFNRGNPQYHLAVKNYDSLTDLYNAILAKEAIDIIDLSGVSVEKLSKQGVFADLAPYLEQSEKFKSSDFLNGLLEAYTFDGVLVGIPEAFTMQTLVGDRTQLGGSVGLSLEGLFETLSRSPGALPFDGPYKEGTTREEAMRYLMMFNEDVFIDWDTGECRFDSEDFRKVLELCSRYPEGNESDRRSGSDSEVSLPTRLQSGEILFAVANMGDIKDFQLYEAIFGETAAGIGFPTADGKGGTLLYGENAFGISAGSENKDAAWKFVESIPDWKIKDGMGMDEIFHLYWLPDKFPALKKTLDIIVEYRIQDDQEWVAKGHRAGGRTYEDGWSFDYHIVTQDEIDAILNLVKEATPAFSVENDEILKIINEEAPGYYSGQKSAEDVVGVIQNRVRLYVDENR